jgi:hypothetical protein
MKGSCMSCLHAKASAARVSQSGVPPTSAAAGPVAVTPIDCPISAMARSNRRRGTSAAPAPAGRKTFTRCPRDQDASGSQPWATTSRRIVGDGREPPENPAAVLDAEHQPWSCARAGRSDRPAHLHRHAASMQTKEWKAPEDLGAAPRQQRAERQQPLLEQPAEQDGGRRTQLKRERLDPSLLDDRLPALGRFPTGMMPLRSRSSCSFGRTLRGIAAAPRPVDERHAHHDGRDDPPVAWRARSLSSRVRELVEHGPMPAAVPCPPSKPIGMMPAKMSGCPKSRLQQQQGQGAPDDVLSPRHDLPVWPAAGSRSTTARRGWGPPRLKTGRRTPR